MGCLTVKVNSIREREIKIDKKFIGVYVNIVIQDYFFPFLSFSSPFTGWLNVFLVIYIMLKASLMPNGG